MEVTTVRFTLIYQGDLPPSGNAKDKWRIRREIEPQLRKLWTLPPFDSIAKYIDPTYQPNDCYVGKKIKGIEFIPCISTRLYMRAELSVRLFSASMPGGLVLHGDIDNRLKTLLDALSIPTEQQIPKNPEIDSDGRMFSLLEDDKLVTRVEVANDRLLTESDQSRNAIVLIDVHPVASTVTLANIGISI
jgi:hypothetical protein